MRKIRKGVSSQTEPWGLTRWCVYDCVCVCVELCSKKYDTDMHTTSMNLSVFMRTGKWTVMINKGKEGSVSSRQEVESKVGKKRKGSTV